MIACNSYYDARQCGRPKDHPDKCGGLVSTYETFKPGRPLREYRDTFGHEVGGMALSSYAFAALAAAATSGDPCELVVTGKDIREDGVWFLRFSATTAHIEATTDYRDDGHGLHYVCPDCGRKTGTHSRGCKQR